MTKIKICGLYREEDIRYVNEAGPDFAGFIINFPKSHRNVSVEQMRVLRERLDPRIVPVGVFVDAPVALAAGLLNDRTLSVIQLHGHEDDDYIFQLRSMLRPGAPSGPDGIQIIRAFQIRKPEDVERAQKCPADMILLDGGTGDGKVFDWTLLKKVHRPYMLAGGLGPENVAQAILQLHPWGVDMSSGVETEKIKDRDKIRSVIRIVRKSDSDGGWPEEAAVKN